MRELRFRCVLLAAWISVLHYADHFPDPLVLIPFSGLMAGILALVIVLVRRLNAIPLVWLLLPVPVLAAIRFLLNYSVGIPTTPGTLIEPLVLGITIALARGVGRSLQEFRRSLVSTLFRRAGNGPLPFETGQAEIYREIRRARAHHRPLALMTIRPAEKEGNVQLDRFARQVADEIARDYLTVQLAKFLSSRMSDSEVIVQRDDGFVVLLPETGRDQADEVASQLAAAAKKQLGLDLQLGTSVFPDEEITFVGLLEQAEGRTDGKAKRAPVGPRPAEPPTFSRITRGEGDVGPRPDVPGFESARVPHATKASCDHRGQPSTSTSEHSPGRASGDSKS